jgi:cobalt/nickel transport system permease protein
MTLGFSPPPTLDSPLRRLDPRWKLAAFAPAVAAAAAVQTLTGALAALAGSLLLALFGRLRWRCYLGRLAALAGLMTLFVLPMPFLVSGNAPLWAWGPLQVSGEGVRFAGVIACKAVAVATIVLLLLTSAPPDATLKAAHALKVPGLLIQLALLSYRYLFVLANEFSRLRVALRVRGYRNRPAWHSYRTVGAVAGTLVVRGYERAERVGQAMRCRGFDGRYRSLAEFSTRPADVLAFFLVLAGAASVCWADGLLKWR